MARLIQGKLSYAHGAPGEIGREIGREWFTITNGADGTRTLRCLCEIDADGLTRDVVYTVDHAFQPLDCFVRLSVGNRFAGTGWFRFGDGFGEGEILTEREGRLRQRLTIEGRVKAFGTHPICADIWKLPHLTPMQPGKLQYLTSSMNCSPLENGGSGPVLARKEYSYFYRGAETVTVAAGTFNCQRYDWPVRPDKTLCMWTTGPDFLPVRMTAPEVGKTYDLVELSVRD